MVEPRSYRTGKSVTEALQELESMTNRYDSNVVHALREVIESPTGDKVLQREENSLIRED
jgi:HD-GYP domain-containing protein (c-di-GMP phosphodiesterase class II)